MGEMVTSPGVVPEILHSPRDVEALASRLQNADAIAVDVEGNGLFAYRARLCTVQLAFREKGSVCVAIVDALTAPIRALAAALGPDGPTKVLHDLAFDARMLHEAGVTLARAHDTTVFARFLGHEATGLARVLVRELGITLDKRLQLHDWSRRPLGAEEIEYLTGDVAHLLDLYDALHARAQATDILDEADVESAHRLASAIAPDDDPRPAYARLKHANQLGPIERAVLRRIHAVREELAHRADVPPYRILPNERLLAVARAAPRDARELLRIAGTDLPHPELWMGALGAARDDGDIPEEERVYFERRAISPERAQRRRQLEGLLTGWRRREAAERGVSEQVVLPGHCLSSLVDLFLDPPIDFDDRVRSIPGLGSRRPERYLDPWKSAIAAAEPRGMAARAAE
jgi:ribonuclease D